MPLNANIAEFKPTGNLDPGLSSMNATAKNDAAEKQADMTSKSVAEKALEGEGGRRRRRGRKSRKVSRKSRKGRRSTRKH